MEFKILIISLGLVHHSKSEFHFHQQNLEANIENCFCQNLVVQGNDTTQQRVQNKNILYFTPSNMLLPWTLIILVSLVQISYVSSLYELIYLLSKSAGFLSTCSFLHTILSIPSNQWPIISFLHKANPTPISELD